MATKLKWDQTGERFYETGASHAILFLGAEKKTATIDSVADVITNYGAGVAWNGFTGCDESPDGADITKKYANNGEYVSFRAAEALNFTIKAFTYPTEWKICDGRRYASDVEGFSVGQQTRKRFGFVYETIKGNDTEENDFARIFHVYYGCTASPSDRSYETVNDSPDNIEFSWECSTTTITASSSGSAGEQALIAACAPGKSFIKMVSLEIDTSKLNASQVTALEHLFWGLDSPTQDGHDPMLPEPGDILRILQKNKSAVSG
jgi:hypothetical protein